MNPSSNVRSACESLMSLVRRDKSDSREIVAALQNVAKAVSDESDDIEQYVEFVLLPLFFLHPSEASECKSVPERVLEECMKCMVLIIARTRDSFNNRPDLFFPTYIRALAALTDVEKDGQLATYLKEETKLAAVCLLGALITTQHQFDNLEPQVVFHSAALLIDISSKERSKELRAEALGTLIMLTQRLSPAILDYMYPGVASSLCEIGRADFKSGSRVPELALECLSLCSVKVLGDERRNPTADVRADGESIDKETEDENYFVKLFPLLVRLLGEDADSSAPVTVRLARCKLVNGLLNYCRIVVQAHETAFPILLRRLIAACADEDTEVASTGDRSFDILRSTMNITPKESLKFRLQLEHLLVDCISRMSSPSNKEDDSLLSCHFAMSAFLLKHLEGKYIRSVFDANMKTIVWSLLLTFQVDPTRFDQRGVIEFARISTSACNARACTMLAAIGSCCPQAARSIAEQLLEAVEDCVKMQRKTNLSLGGMDGSIVDNEDDDDESVMLLPRSSLAQAIFLVSELLPGDHAVLRRFLEMDGLWLLPTRPSPTVCSPQEAVSNALARAAALECIRKSAERVGPEFKFNLVDTLFPLLQCLGDESPGVKLAADMAIAKISVICKYGSVSEMLQGNVDYVVDSIVRRLPHFHANDSSFAEVIEVLIAQIPVWVRDEETSPWVQDLVHTVLDGLDDRGNSPHIAWSLLRIADVVVTRASSVTTGQSSLKALEEGQVGLTPLIEVNNLHDAIAGSAIGELSTWTITSQQQQTRVDEVDSNDNRGDAGSEDGEDVRYTSTQEHAVNAVESILLKTAHFLTDDDVLIRQQSAKVATTCIMTLGEFAPDRARTAIHQIWSTIIEQLREEKNPVVIELLMDSLAVAASSAIGVDFFARRFADEAWPVLETVLDRGAPSSKERKSRYRQPSFREFELAKKVLKCLPRLGAMLKGPAERVAFVTVKYIGASNDESSREMKRLAYEVWVALATHAGDVIWLATGLAAQQITVPKGRKPVLIFQDTVLAAALWKILSAQ